MPTSQISNTIKANDGTFLAGVPVVIDLIPGPAFRLSDGTEILPVVETKTDATGLWTVLLEQNSNVDPSSSYYRVREMVPRVKGGPRVWYFLVPGVSPSKLHDCLYVPSVANSLIRPVVVTSTTMPVSPYIGMQVFQSDTGRVLYYYGSTVGWQPDWGQGWGELGGVSAQTADFTTSSTTYAIVTALTTGNLNALTGRQYLTVFSATCTLATTATTLYVGIYEKNTNTQLCERQIILGSVPITFPVEIYYREKAISGTINRDIRIAVGVGTAVGGVSMSAAHPAALSFRDIGALAPPVIT